MKSVIDKTVHNSEGRMLYLSLILLSIAQFLKAKEIQYEFHVTKKRGGEVIALLLRNL